jgi:3-hydroxyacyl-[acyl-carrier-protein] dehydratase
MLLNDFFFIQKSENANGQLKVDIRIDKNHKIFEGHFPAIPIVPGVCMMQMMREIMEKEVKRSLIIRHGDNMKFLSVINPTEHSEIQADIKYDETPEGNVNINASLFSGATTFFKLKATLTNA